MDDFSHYATYLLSFIAVLIPGIGLGAGPAIIVKFLLVAFGGNAYSQIDDNKVIDNYLVEHKDKKIIGDLYEELSRKT